MSAPTADQILRVIHLRPYRPYMGPRFSLRMWDTYRTDSRGVSILGYRLRMHTVRSRYASRTERVTLFEGEDFAGSPMYAIDSDRTVAALLGFLTLRPGDTDQEYFANYTDEQIAFCEQHAETLHAEAIDRFGED